MILRGSKERGRFVKFAIVGAVGSAIDFGVMNLLTQLISIRLVFAGTISFICAVLNNFTGNRFWTYPESRSRPMLHQLGMFFLVNAAGIALRIPILHFMEPPIADTFESMVHLSHASAEILARNATLGFAIAVVMLWNYFVNRYWTYNDIE